MNELILIGSMILSTQAEKNVAGFLDRYRPKMRELVPAPGPTLVIDECGQLSALWQEGAGFHAETAELFWSLNYMRFSPSGRVVVDLRNFAEVRYNTPSYGLGMQTALEGYRPPVDYVIDRDDNLWLFYPDNDGFVSWRVYDAQGKLREEVSPRKWYMNEDMKAYVDSARIVHIVANPNPPMYGAMRIMGYGHYYLQYDHRTHEAVIDTAFKGILVRNHEGRVVRLQLPDRFDERMDEYVYRKIPIAKNSILKELRVQGELFAAGTSIYYVRIVTADASQSFAYVFSISAEGSIVRPEKVLVGKLLSTDDIPKGTPIHVSVSPLALYGVDASGNVYAKSLQKVK